MTEGTYEIEYATAHVEAIMAKAQAAIEILLDGPDGRNSHVARAVKLILDDHMRPLEHRMNRLEETVLKHHPNPGEREVTRYTVLARPAPGTAEPPDAADEDEIFRTAAAMFADLIARNNREAGNGASQHQQCGRTGRAGRPWRTWGCDWRRTRPRPAGYTIIER